MSLDYSDYVSGYKLEVYSSEPDRYRATVDDCLVGSPPTTFESQQAAIKAAKVEIKRRVAHTRIDFND